MYALCWAGQAVAKARSASDWCVARVYVRVCVYLFGCFVLSLAVTNLASLRAAVRLQVAQHKFVHLSAGDLLRAEIARGSSQGTSIKALIERGLLVPVDVTLTLLKAAMKTSAGDRYAEQ